MLMACGFPNRRHDLRIWEPLPRGPEALSSALLQSTGTPLRPGNRVKLLRNGEVFDAIEDEIARAESSIHIVVYLWQPGAPSDRILRALGNRRRGVSCRVMVDPLQSQRFDEVALRLSALGCEWRISRPMDGALRRLDVRTMLARNHRKVIIRDGRAGITGGFGIWRSWLGDGRTPEAWRDTAALIEGPAVREMQLAFSQNWQEAGGSWLPEAALPALSPVGGTAASFIASSPGATISDAIRMTAVTVAAAHERLWITNSYFIPSTALVDMLVRKAREGVDVRILVPGRYMDMAPVHAAQRSTYDRLLEAGVRIWEYEVSMLHAKTLVVDRDLAVVGSINLDPVSMQSADEGSVVIWDRDFTTRLASDFERDLRYSREIMREGWSRRGILDRFPDVWPAIIGPFL
jgi:cardiolipin synthase